MRDIEDLIGIQIQKIYCKEFNAKTTGYVEIVIQTLKVYLQLTIDDETDEIIIQILPKLDISELSKPLWAEKIEGKSLMQIWGLENDKGYSDLICLGLDEVIPTVVFSVVASEIKVGFVHYVEKK